MGVCVELHSKKKILQSRPYRVWGGGGTFMSTPTLEWLAEPFDHVVDRRVWCWCAQVGDPALTSRVLTMLQTKKSHFNPTTAGKAGGAGGAEADNWSLEAHPPELVPRLAAPTTQSGSAPAPHADKLL